jgi:multidrug efflux system outer membrane protein
MALAAGCMVGPDYERPPLDMPENYVEPASTDPSIANVPWWELFQDDALKGLITEALANNRDLAIAVSRIEEAAAALSVVRANQYPFVDVVGRAGRVSPSESTAPQASSENDFLVSGAASFELDFWGKLRRATAGARADLLGQEANARNVTITLVSAVASTYFLLLDFDDRLEISRRTFESREHGLDIIRARFDKGTVPELDVNQAESQAADAQAAIAQYERAQRQAENALSVLVGSNPRAILRGTDLASQAMPMDVPAGLPAELLERRPDLVAAEQALIAETERIGVARAQRLPSFTLTGTFGYSSRDLDDLLDSDNQAWDAFANVFAPLFNSGQLRSVEKAQRAEQARLQYEGAVLNALRDVDNSLTAVRTLRDEHRARLRQLDAAENAARLSWARYNGGVVSYLEVLDSERVLFSVQILESLARQQQLNAVVGLYRALGGGWPASEAR